MDFLRPKTDAHMQRTTDDNGVSLFLRLATVANDATPDTALEAWCECLIICGDEEHQLGILKEARNAVNWPHLARTAFERFGQPLWNELLQQIDEQIRRTEESING